MKSVVNATEFRARDTSFGFYNVKREIGHYHEKGHTGFVSVSTKWYKWMVNRVRNETFETNRTFIHTHYGTISTDDLHITIQ